MHARRDADAGPSIPVPDLASWGPTSLLLDALIDSAHMFARGGLDELEVTCAIIGPAVTCFDQAPPYFRVVVKRTVVFTGSFASSKGRHRGSYAYSCWVFPTLPVQ